MVKHLMMTAGAAAALAGSAAVAAEGSNSSSPPCRVADLAARIVPGSPGAGQRYATLRLTNRSDHSCHTYGYVGLLLRGRHGRALATDVVRDRTIAPRRVALAPGDHAAARLHWTVVPGRGDHQGPCATAPLRVDITPPDERAHLTIRWRGGIVCQRGRIDVRALVRAR